MMDPREAKERLKDEILRHVGPNRAIGMGELFEIVFQERWKNRINDTRALRLLVDELRRKGVPILSDTHGYWLCGSDTEMIAYCRRVTNQGLRKLHQVSVLKKLTLPEYLGQLSLNLGAAPPNNDKGR
jgi:hypothetical protein